MDSMGSRSINMRAPHWLPEFLTETQEYLGGVQKVYTFPNGLGASVIKHTGSYGYDQGKWEIAVLDNGELTYSTTITNDVIGYLNEPEVDNILNQIKDL